MDRENKCDTQNSMMFFLVSTKHRLPIERRPKNTVGFDKIIRTHIKVAEDGVLWGVLVCHYNSIHRAPRPSLASLLCITVDHLLSHITVGEQLTHSRFRDFSFTHFFCHFPLLISYSGINHNKSIKLSKTCTWIHTDNAILRVSKPVTSSRLAGRDNMKPVTTNNYLVMARTAHQRWWGVHYNAYYIVLPN